MQRVTAAPKQMLSQTELKAATTLETLSSNQAILYSVFAVVVLLLNSLLWQKHSECIHKQEEVQRFLYQDNETSECKLLS